MRPSPRPIALVALVVGLVLARQAGAESEGFLHFKNASGSFDLLFKGFLDLEYFLLDDEPPGLLFDEHSVGNYRLRVFADGAIGEELSLFVQSRLDRGFDPGDRNPEIRIDESFLRYTHAIGRGSYSLEVGKFATPLGNFVPRHDAFHNPLVRAPIPYDHMTTVGDDVAPASNQAQINRRDIRDRKNDWVTMIWGPVYHTGVMAFGNHKRLDLRLALTNAAPSERPQEWNFHPGDGGALATSGRVGYTPVLGVNLGLNYAIGPYFRRSAVLPAGIDRRDFDQTLLGLDMEYSRGHLRLFSEVFGTEWEVPRVTEPLRAIGYYIEGRYALRPGLFVAGRWNEILYNDIPDARGNPTPWDWDAHRAEVGVGYFFRPKRVLGKIAFEVNDMDGPRDLDDVLSVSLTTAF